MASSADERRAVRNNAAWCDAVCRALGGDTAWEDGLWTQLSPSPPYYSNAITLNPDASVPQLRRIGAMLAGPLPRPWTVKDAYHTLDLGPLGFEVLFEARWITLEPGMTLRLGAAGSAWEPVTTDADLARWEHTWRGANPDADAATLPRLFQPALLVDPDIRFLWCSDDGRIVALAIANRSDDGSGPVVGISNIVLTGDDPMTQRRGAVAAVQAAFPGLPMVGYEQGDDLAAMETLGFRSLGPLRVWRSPS